MHCSKRLTPAAPRLGNADEHAPWENDWIDLGGEG